MPELYTRYEVGLIVFIAVLIGYAWGAEEQRKRDRKITERKARENFDREMEESWLSSGDD
jgi:hypothetical protein